MGPKDSIIETDELIIVVIRNTIAMATGPDGMIIELLLVEKTIIKSKMKVTFLVDLLNVKMTMKPYSIVQQIKAFINNPALILCTITWLIQPLNTSLMIYGLKLE
jgi:hypothetical protein